MFGGGNCEGEMGRELHRSFPWIDYVCSGEGEYSFPQLVQAIAAGRKPLGIPGHRLPAEWRLRRQRFGQGDHRHERRAIAELR